MKKLMIFVFLFAIVISSANAVVAPDKKDLIGTWKYEVPSAPYGYEKGTIVFAEKDGKLVGEVKFADGYKIEMKEVTYETGTVRCNLYIDYENINVKATFEGNKLTGTVNSSEGEMKLTAEKQK